MSLINQMLRDLESRQAAQGRETRPLPPGLSPDAPRRPRLPWLGVFVILGFVALGAVAAIGMKSYWTTATVAEPQVAETPAPQPDARGPATVAPEVARPQRLTISANAGPDALVFRLDGGPDASPVHRREGRRGEVVFAGVAPPADDLALDDPRLSGWQLAPVGPDTRLRYTAAADVEITAETRDGVLELRFTRNPPPVVAAEPAPPAPVAAAPAVEPPSAEETVVVTRRPPQLSPAERAEAAYREGLEALNAGQVATAQQSLERALTLAPGHREARKALGGLLIGTDRAVAGEGVLAEGIHRDPADTELRMLLARSQVGRGEVDAAVATLEAGLPSGQHSPDYRAFLGALYQRVSRHEAAIAEYHAALSGNPSVPAWWAGLGISLEAAGRPRDAAESYRRALRLPGLSAGLEQYIRQRLGVIG